MGPHLKSDVIPIPCMVMAEVRNRNGDCSRGNQACFTIGDGSRTAHEGRTVVIHVQRSAHHHIQDELETDHTQT